MEELTRNTELTEQLEKSEQTEQPEVEPKKEDYLVGKVVNCKSLNVRKRPSLTADIETRINKGDEVLIDEEASIGSFYKVVIESGVEGFCMKKYIEI